MIEFLTTFGIITVIVIAGFGWFAAIITTIAIIRDRRRTAATDAWVRAYNADLVAKAIRTHATRQRELKAVAGGKQCEVVTLHRDGPHAA